MSSTTRLLVLGVVRTFQPVHGYDVRRELISWRASEWASVQPGSIYNALKTLTRDGYLEVVGTDQVGGRPERTSYRITSAGNDEFRSLLREEWWTVRPPIDPLIAAVSFLGFVARDEAIAALEHRIVQIRGMVRHVEFAIEAHDGSESPYHVREMMRLLNARTLAEVDWAEQFIRRLRSGEFSTAEDPPWQPAAVLSRAPGTKPPKPRAARPSKAQAPPSSTSARKNRTEHTEPAGAERSRAGRGRDRRAKPAERTPGNERGPRDPRTPRTRAPRRKPAR
jgi:DNA-binding PadR family transcriptional regulator